MGVYKNIKRFTFSLLPDKLYLTLLFRHRFGYWMDWNNPQTFNEKLQWLKLYYRKSIFTTMVDKYLVKQFLIDLTWNVAGDFLYCIVEVRGNFHCLLTVHLQQ